MTKAKAKLRSPIRSARRARRVNLPGSIENLILGDRRASGAFRDAVVGGTLERTMEGASTLTLQVRDRDRELLRSKTLRKGQYVELDGMGFRLVRIAKTGPELTLTCEDEAVWQLRKRKGFRKIKRGTLTRAQFAGTLVREVRGIGFVSPNMLVPQPVASFEQAERDSAGENGYVERQGIDPEAELTVKGVKADATQRRNMEIVLAEAERWHKTRAALAGDKRPLLAVIEACIVESLFRNLSYGHSSSVGILQLLDIHFGGSVAARMDIERCVKEFMLRGFTSGVGALSLAEFNPTMNPGQIAQHCQGSAHPERYEQYRDEAEQILRAWGGASGDTDRSRRARDHEEARNDGVYEFRRKRGEDTWTCITRLASEVRWRCFAFGGDVYFASDWDLLSTRGAFVVRADDEDVIDVDFDADESQRIPDEAMLTMIGRRWSAPPGTIVRLMGFGPADLKPERSTEPGANIDWARNYWLVRSIRASLVTQELEVELRRYERSKPEPADDGVDNEEDGERRRRNSGSSRQPSRGRANVSRLSDVRLGASGGDWDDYAGTQSIMDQYVTPFLAAEGLAAGSKKRGYDTVDGPAMSDHYALNTTAYAVDYPTYDGEAASRKLARDMGITNWQPNSYTRWSITVGGKRFGVQILWGAAIDHADHIHVGVRAT